MLQLPEYKLEQALEHFLLYLSKAVEVNLNYASDDQFVIQGSHALSLKEMDPIIVTK